MYNINSYLSIEHLSISALCCLVIYLLLRYDEYTISKFLPFIIFLNESFYILSKILNDSFSLSTHLPLELCYLTNVLIFASIIFKFEMPFLYFASIFGALAGFVNSNIANGDFFEYLRFYIGHSTLALFFILSNKNHYRVNAQKYFSAIKMTSFLLLIIFIVNINISSNYWFMFEKPSGINLTYLFPDWPHYFFILLSIGFIVYTITLFANNYYYNNYRRI